MHAVNRNKRRIRGESEIFSVKCFTSELMISGRQGHIAVPVCLNQS